MDVENNSSFFNATISYPQDSDSEVQIPDSDPEVQESDPEIQESDQETPQSDLEITLLKVDNIDWKLFDIDHYVNYSIILILITYFRYLYNYLF